MTREEQDDFNKLKAQNDKARVIIVRQADALARCIRYLQETHDVDGFKRITDDINSILKGIR